MSEFARTNAATMPPNGAAHPPTEEQLRQLAQQDVIVSATFARIVSVLMRSPQHRHMSLADLEWLVFPPLMLGQFAVLDGKQDRVALPVPKAVVLWAWVSPEVDHCISATLTEPAEA